MLLKPGSVSAMAGTSGIELHALRVTDADRADFAGAEMRLPLRNAAEDRLDAAGDEIDRRGAAALVGHVGRSRRRSSP